MPLRISAGETIGVILLNLGGPDSLDAVRPFLYNLFSDRQIIQLGPPFLQNPLAKLISVLRSGKTRRMYSLIGGKSPIFEITTAQARALEDALNWRTYDTPVTGGNRETAHFRVYVGMRYWLPYIDDVVPRIYEEGIRKLIALSLYPQYSVATSGSSLSKFTDAAAAYEIETLSIPSWHDHPGYIEALVDVIKKGLESFDDAGNVHVLFSAHSLPKKIIERGDPYVDQTMGTIGEITKRLPLKWHLGYQSKSGPVEWLEPSTDAKIKELARSGVKDILMVPISFVSDHIETLYEIDILYKKLAEELGLRLKRSDSLNSRPKFIMALKDIIEKSVENAG